jgi:hypothetical protein
MSRKRQAETQAGLATLTPKPTEAATPQLPATIAKPELALAPLAEMATAINAVFDAETTALNTAKDKRLEAGRLLKEVRDRLQAAALNKDTPNSISFDSWCKRNIKRSKADIYQCISLVSAKDPAKARDAEKTRAREGMKAARAKAKAAPQSVTLQPSQPAAPAMPAPIAPITVPWESAPITAEMYISVLNDLGVAFHDNAQLGKIKSDSAYFEASMANMIAAAKTFLARMTPQSDQGE